MQMPFPRPRGEISAVLCEMLAGSDLRKAGECLAAAAEAISVSEDLLYDEDLQLSLFILYGLNRNWFIGVDGRTDWELRLSGIRTVIETAFEDRLRRDVEPLDLTAGTGDDVGEALANMVRGDDAPSVADFVFRSATIDQAREFLIHESAHRLGVADPRFLDEGVPETLRPRLFARTMELAELDPRPGAYADYLPAISLASANLVSFFGLHRRLAGAAHGHVTVGEMLSRADGSKLSCGLARLGFDPEATRCFEVESGSTAGPAPIATNDRAGGPDEDDPGTRDQMFFGAAASCLLHDLVDQWQLDSWEAGDPSLCAPLHDSGEEGSAGE